MQKVSSLNWGIGVKMPYVTNACVKANSMAPSDKVIEGLNIAKLITSSHLTQLVHKSLRPSVIAAEALMVDSRQLCDVMQIADLSRIKTIGKLDVRLVLHLLKLGKSGEGRAFASIAEIAQASKFQ